MDKLTTKDDNSQIIMRDARGKDQKHRLGRYVTWMNQSGRTWHSPDLVAYREYLLDEYTTSDDELLNANSVKAHLSTIRGRYQAVLRDNRTRDALYDLTPTDASPSDRKAFVDEIVKRIENAIDPINTEVKTITHQDRADEEHIRLTTEEAAALLHAPGIENTIAVRDTAIISMMLCTGVREAELCNLKIPDLSKTLGGEPALHIRRGKGAKERLVPYGELIWVLDIVDQWLSLADIKEGFVFRGMYKGGKRARSTKINVRTINKILDRYPIEISGQLKRVNPHDLRRTYARRLYEAGVDLLAIRDNLGHSDTKTTLRYIGTMDVEKRNPPKLYNFNPLS